VLVVLSIQVPIQGRARECYSREEFTTKKTGFNDDKKVR